MLSRRLARHLLRLTRQSDRIAASLLERVGPEVSALEAYRQTIQRFHAQIFTQPFSVAERAYWAEVAATEAAAAADARDDEERDVMRPHWAPPPADGGAAGGADGGGAGPGAGVATGMMPGGSGAHAHLLVRHAFASPGATPAMDDARVDLAFQALREGGGLLYRLEVALGWARALQSGSTDEAQLLEEGLCLMSAMHAGTGGGGGGGGGGELAARSRAILDGIDRVAAAASRAEAAAADASHAATVAQGHAAARALPPPPPAAGPLAGFDVRAMQPWERLLRSANHAVFVELGAAAVDPMAVHARPRPDLFLLDTLLGAAGADGADGAGADAGADAGAGANAPPSAADEDSLPPALYRAGHLPLGSRPAPPVPVAPLLLASLYVAAARRAGARVDAAYFSRARFDVVAVPMEFTGSLSRSITWTGSDGPGGGGGSGGGPYGEDLLEHAEMDLDDDDPLAAMHALASAVGAKIEGAGIVAVSDDGSTTYMSVDEFLAGGDDDGLSDDEDDELSDGDLSDSELAGVFDALDEESERLIEEGIEDIEQHMRMSTGTGRGGDDDLAGADAGGDGAGGPDAGWATEFSRAARNFPQHILVVVALPCDSDEEAAAGMDLVAVVDICNGGRWVVLPRADLEARITATAAAAYDTGSVPGDEERAALLDAAKGRVWHELRPEIVFEMLA